MKTEVVLIPSPVFPTLKAGSATLTPVSYEKIKENFVIVENKIRQFPTTEHLMKNGITVPPFTEGFWDGKSTSNVALVARIRATQGDTNEDVEELELAILTYYEAETQEHWE